MIITEYYMTSEEALYIARTEEVASDAGLYH